MKLLLLAVICLASLSLACRNCPSLQANFLAQANRELLGRWNPVSGQFARFQAYNVIKSGATAHIEVCHVPPFVDTPSVAHLTRLMSEIYGFPDFDPLFVFLAHASCYAHISDPTACIELTISPSAACPDAQLFTTPSKIELTWRGLRGVPSAISSDLGALWSRASVETSEILNYMHLATEMQDNSTPDGNISTSLLRLSTALSARSSSVQSLLNSIFPTQNGPHRFTPFNLLSDIETIQGLASVEWNQLAESISTEFPASWNDLACKNQPIWRKLFSSLPSRGLQVIETAFNHTAIDFKDPLLFLKLQNVDELLEHYYPTYVAHRLDLMMHDFFGVVTTLLTSLKLNFPSHAPLLSCFQHKLVSLHHRFNMTYYLTHLEDIDCQLQQEFGLFEESPFEDCVSVCLATVTQHGHSLNTEVVFFNFTNPVSGENGTKTMLDFSNRISWSSPSLLSNSPTLINYTSELNPNWNVTGELVSSGLVQIHHGVLVPFDTIESPLEKRFPLIGGDRQRSGGQNEGSKRSDLASCLPGYFAQFNPVTQIYDCLECPIGSYCLGTDGLKRLCSNGPIDRVNYTQALQTNASCPWICALVSECIQGNDCVLPSPGFRCLDTRVQSCPSSPWPNLWDFDKQCSASFHHVATLSGNMSCNGIQDSPWCRFTKIPNGDFDFSLWVRFDDIVVNTTVLNLIIAEKQFKLDLITNSSQLYALAYSQMSSSGIVTSYLRSAWKNLSLRKWHRVRMLVSSSNYLVLMIDDMPVLYSFFDSTLPGQLPNTGRLTVGQISSSPSSDFRYSISSLVITNDNQTDLSDFLSSTPLPFFDLFCNLAVSDLLEDGTCVSKCLKGQKRHLLGSGRSICGCDELSLCSRSAGFQSAIGCENSQYTVWKGRYLRLDVIKGSAFIAKIVLNSEFKEVVLLTHCGHLSGSGCEKAISNPSFGGWMAKTGQSAIFFLKEEHFISEIGFLFRDSVLDDSISISISLSPMLSDLLNHATEAVLVADWKVIPVPFGTELKEETLEWISPNKARWLASQARNGMQTSWKSNSQCLECPPSSLVSLLPRNSVSDCLCPYGVIPRAGGSTGCERAAQCPAELEIFPLVPSGLYSSPMTLSFWHSEALSSDDILNGTRVEVVITPSDGSPISQLFLRLGERVSFATSVALTYTPTYEGCPSYPSKRLDLQVKPGCAMPTIVLGRTGNSRFVSLFAHSGAIIEVSVDPVPVSTEEPPQFWIYAQGFVITTNSLIRARSRSSTSQCAPSAISYAFVTVGSSALQEPAPGPMSNNVSCGAGCVSIIAFIAIFGILVVIVATYIMITVRKR
jgi:hypothetical protein